MTTRKKLEAARDLIRNPENWCQYVSRIDGDRYCAIGAIRESGGCAVFRGEAPAFMDPAALALWALVDQERYHSVANFNDNSTHAEVLELFNLAIADEIAKEDAHSRHMAEEQPPAALRERSSREREQAEDPAAPLVFA